MRIAAIIQARMGSTRLPGKSLVEIAGKPLLAHVIDRAQACRSVDTVVLATTTESSDAALLRLAASCGVATYVGSANDVLDRYFQAATQEKADVIVRITADDPFKDPEVNDCIIEYLVANPELDYVSNTIEPTYPEGLDVEVFRYTALHRAWTEARLLSEREHVTPYIWKHPELFSLKNIRHSHDLSAMRWTLDYPEDLQFTREIYARLYQGRPFMMTDILALLEREPGLAAINSGNLRNAGYINSLEKDSTTDHATN